MAFLLYKWLISLSLFMGIKEMYHPFYVSVTEIAHNKEERSVEISSKIFIDDLENILKQNYQKPINLSDEKKKAENGKFINDYINKHLKLIADGKALHLNYVGFEKDSEAVFCYFEVAPIISIKNLDIENSILQDLTDQQINIMHVTVNGKRQSYKLDFPNKKASFLF